LGALFEDFRGRYEWKSGSSPALVFQKSTSERNCENLSGGEQLCGQNAAEIGETRGESGVSDGRG
jgi:hypothetical protein